MCHRQLKGVRIDFGEVSQGSCVEMSGVFLASSFIITHFFINLTEIKDIEENREGCPSTTPCYFFPWLPFPLPPPSLLFPSPTPPPSKTQHQTQPLLQKEKTPLQVQTFPFSHFSPPLLQIRRVIVAETSRYSSCQSPLHLHHPPPPPPPSTPSTPPPPHPSTPLPQMNHFPPIPKT